MSSIDFANLLALYEKAEDPAFRQLCQGVISNLARHGHPTNTDHDMIVDPCLANALEDFFDPPSTAQWEDYKVRLQQMYDNASLKPRGAAGAEQNAAPPQQHQNGSPPQQPDAVPVRPPFRYGTEEWRFWFEQETNSVLQRYNESPGCDRDLVAGLVGQLLGLLEKFRKANPDAAAGAGQHEGVSLVFLPILDVLSGRKGGASNSNPGNNSYCAFAEILHNSYRAAGRDRRQKQYWADNLRDLVHFRGGIFINRVAGQCEEIGADDLDAKMKQILRERDESAATARKQRLGLVARNAAAEITRQADNQVPLPAGGEIPGKVNQIPLAAAPQVAGGEIPGQVNQVPLAAVPQVACGEVPGQADSILSLNNFLSLNSKELVSYEPMSMEEHLRSGIYDPNVIFAES